METRTLHLLHGARVYILCGVLTAVCYGATAESVKRKTTCPVSYHRRTVTAYPKLNCRHCWVLVFYLSVPTRIISEEVQANCHLSSCLLLALSCLFLPQWIQTPLLSRRQVFTRTLSGLWRQNQQFGKKI